MVEELFGNDSVVVLRGASENVSIMTGTSVRGKQWVSALLDKLFDVWNA